tara:strand:- start:750 stop:1238 length:489 start_codon:yes stop_codon:yes gene_type:complete
MTEEQYLDEQDRLESIEEKGRNYGKDSKLPKVLGRLVVMFGVFVLVTAYFDDSTSESDQIAIAQKAEEKRKGFHCLSAWDGSNLSMIRVTKKKMRDPKSFEHIETRIAPVVNGQGMLDGMKLHYVSMTYRGRNGFGGMVVEQQTAYVSHVTCSVRGNTVTGI